MKRLIVLAALALATACDDPADQIGIDLTEESAVEIRDGLVFTPSGAVFELEEWQEFPDKTPWLEAAADIVQRVEAEQAQALQSGDDWLMNSVTGNPAPTVLCHTWAYACNRIRAMIPGTQIVYWSNSEWAQASVSDFAQFDAIYLHDGASRVAAIVGSKDVWGRATTGRIALTGVHFEHCGGWAGSGPCRVLKASIDWIHAGTGTGLLMATQSSPNIIPTVAPYNGITYHRNGGGFDHVRITDPGHATMQGSTDASLSNFRQSAHSIFGQIGGFTNVAEICDIYVSYPYACPGTFRPHFLVTSVGVADQDGDGVPDGEDICPTVGDAGQEDANGNGIGDACESAPTVTISPASAAVSSGGSVTFTATAADTDDDPSTLSYEWRVDGIVQNGADGTSFTHSFSADATVRVTVTDPGLLSGFADAEVTVQTNQPPTADAGGPYSGVEGSPTALSLSASDPDGDALSYTWDFGDGTTGSGATLPTGHTYDDNGSYTITMTADDGNGTTASSTATATITNAAPTASFGNDGPVDEGSAFTLSMGDAADASAADEAAGFTFSFDCGDGNGASGFGSSSSAACATSDNGSRSVAATIRDKDGGETQYTATVEVENVAPSVTATGPAQVYSGESPTLTGTFGDPGADSPWSWSADWSSGTESGIVDEPGSFTSSRQVLALGTTTVEMTVTDKDGASGMASVAFEVLRLPVGMDVKPGNGGEVDPINPSAGGVTPMALLSGDGFDATTADLSTLAAGPGEAPLSARGAGGSFEDVDEDGDLDLVLHFDTQALGLGSDATQVCVTGVNSAGVSFEGCDEIRIVGGKGKNK